MSDSKDSPTVVPQTRWFTVDEAATYKRVSPGTIRKEIHEGKIKAVREGNGYRIDRLDIDRQMESRKKFHGAYRVGTHPWVADRWAKKRKKAAR
jgi:excisionase family DNA binding protein